MCIVYEAIEDRIGDGGLLDVVVPTVDGQLSYHYCGRKGVPVFDDFQEITSLGWTHRINAQIVDDEDLSSRENIKMIHMLAKHGAKWLPNDRSKISDARRSLLRMKPDYTVEFIWIMSKYKACRREDIEELVRTPSIRSLISQYRSRIDELLKELGGDAKT